MEKIAEVGLLYDFYGGLLTERQKEVLRLYHEENLSLGEIARDLSISRQGVHDTLKKAEASLYDYEVKLELVKKFRDTGDRIRQIETALDEIISRGEDPRLKAELRRIRQEVDDLIENY